jgi:hypothetical protein
VHRHRRAGGRIDDDAEFLLRGSTVAFRAAASSDGFPFSNAEAAVERNRERLLRVRGRLFNKSGWSCGCPPDANPIDAARCALFCN